MIDPSKGTKGTAAETSATSAADLLGGTTVKTGTEAETKVPTSIPIMGGENPGIDSTVKTGTEAETKVPTSIPIMGGENTSTDPTVKTGTAAETSIPGGNVSTPADKATDGTATTPAAPASTPTISGSSGGLVPCTDDCTLCHLVLGIKGIFDFLLKLLLATCLLGITIAGVLYMVSAGSSSLIEKAKKPLPIPSPLFVLLLCSWLIVNAVMNALGFKQAGGWSSFTCDTTQTVAPILATGAGIGAGAGAGTGKGGGISGKGRDIQVPQDGSKLAQALEKEKKCGLCSWWRSQ